MIDMEDKYQDILNSLKKIRKYKKVNQSDIGAYLGISGQAYGKIELGKAEMGLKTFFKICLFLEVNPSDVIKQLTYIIL